ncbi:MAG: hypothetical protein KA257_08925 [Opitutaceae bacterium]|nr:hypothetical protein [Opitutaceae bacterium]MBP9903320.1 hypothetical protein [Verrucomicrobiota bacterium]
MSTLQETLQQRRSAEQPSSRSSDSADAQVRSLQIHSWNGEKWVLPWSGFAAACHRGTGEGEQLLLSFANHEVVLNGERLALLLPEIASLHLDCLRDMPAKFRSLAGNDEPFISRVSVRSASDLPDFRPETSGK